MRIAFTVTVALYRVAALTRCLHYQGLTVSALNTIERAPVTSAATDAITMRTIAQGAARRYITTARNRMEKITVTAVRGRRFRQLLVKRIAAERQLFLSAVAITDITVYPGGADEWGCIGTVEVSYSPFFSEWRALYGFDALARVSIYMD